MKVLRGILFDCRRHDWNDLLMIKKNQGFVMSPGNKHQLDIEPSMT